jgi:L-threonylcarbamoyladenylate synthase
VALHADHMPTVLPTRTPEQFETAVRMAVAALRAGEAVALPTETVYGLAANALDARAVEKIFAIKGRPAQNPIIVHVSSIQMARRCAAEWPELAQRLAGAFWPGPLTLVLPKSQLIPSIVTASGNTVGVRWPKHPLMEAVLRKCDFPLAAPSANASGQVSPTTAEHVQRSLGSRIQLVVDGGPTPVGIESTVLDLVESPPRLLRPGMIDRNALEAVIGPLALLTARPGAELRSPGLLVKHYAPRAKLVLWNGDGKALAELIARSELPPEHVHLLLHQEMAEDLKIGRVCRLPADPPAFAQALYAELHRSDDAGARLIIVQAVPGEPRWQAVSDRLTRAAA